MEQRRGRLDRQLLRDPDEVGHHLRTYAARPEFETGFKRKTKGGRGNGASFSPKRTITFADIVAENGRGRTSDTQVSYSERGNLQGNQFWALAGRVYELAKAKGLGREIPTEWFLQDIRD